MGDFVKVAEIGEINEGESKQVEINTRKIALFNIDGNYYATDDTCTHQKASISKGEIEGDVVSCPHHGARFNIKTGAVLSLPAMFPLKTYTVNIDGNDIKIVLD